MIAIQREFGKSEVGYAAGDQGMQYDHNVFLAQDRGDDGDDEGILEATDPEICLLSSAAFQQYAADRGLGPFTCQGHRRLGRELYCRRCLDHQVDHDGGDAGDE